jgi:uncharacterized protein YcfJ
MTEAEYSKKVEEALAAMSGGFTGFVGDDDCENCRGWNGIDRRCDCGNRRVSWVDDDMGGIYAEAW